MTAGLRALAGGRLAGWAYRAGLGGPLTLAWRAVQGGDALRHELDLRRALRTLRRERAFLRDGAELEQAGRPLLLVSLANWIMQVKAEGMFAKALQLRGLSPVALTSHRYVHARAFFRAFGVRRFVDLEDFAHPGDAEAVEAETRAALDRLTDVPSMMAYQYRGTYVGRHVLSTVCRTLRHGTPDLASPRVRELLDRVLPEAMHTALRGERALAALQPHSALFLERGYTPYGELYDLAINAGVNTIQWVGAHVNEALIVRRCTEGNRHDHPFSLAEETWEEVKARPWTQEQDAAIQREFDERYQQGAWFMRQRLQDGKRVKTVDEVRAQLGLDPAKRTAVVFSHLFWDATFFFGEDVFDTYEQWLVETVRAACRNPAINWVIKLHPANVWKLRDNAPTEFVEEVALREQVGPLPKHIVLVRPQTDINTYSFFQLMDYCLTVRGTIGMEAPCYGIPVLTAGTGRYSGRGFTIDAKTRAEYLGRLARIQDIPRLGPAEIELARRHAYALFKLRPFPIDSFRLMFPGVDTPSHPLDHDVDVRVRSTAELRGAADLNAFATWAVDGKRLDYLAPRSGA
ncbi:MAG: hypothetical protein FJ027_03565 [Candidatus Rokubacteria bacterium]|nr:hypothetical protein [Candidatus Rokubacteria bacterium]